MEEPSLRRIEVHGRIVKRGHGGAVRLLHDVVEAGVDSVVEDAVPFEKSVPIAPGSLWVCLSDASNSAASEATVIFPVLDFELDRARDKMWYGMLKDHAS
jgi:hypothetical protein